MMQSRVPFAPSAFAVAATVLLAAGAQDFQSEEIIAVERAALDRWSNGDPEGYLEAYAANVTYFDPTTARRVDGIEAMRALLSPLRGQFRLARYEILGPGVVRRDSLAVLSYNLVTYGSQPNGEPIVTRWNTTSAYLRVDGAWRIVHSHFSLSQPQVPGVLAQ